MSFLEIAPANSSKPRNVELHQRQASLTRKSPRRRAVLVACNACRAKKAACDGQRPSCARCIQTLSVCMYVTASAKETFSMALKHQLDSLQEQLKEHAEILDHLRSLPDSEALKVIRQLKSTTNASLVLASIKGSVYTAVRPSDYETSRAILPDTDSSIELELTLQHGTAYPILEPLDIGSIEIDDIFHSSRVVSTPMSPFDAAYSFDSGPESNNHRNHVGLPAAPDLMMTTPVSTADSSPKLNLAGPVVARQLCDPRLIGLNVHYWTSVPIGNGFAASALSHYFQLCHPIFACFDPNLFLSDLVDQRLEYCTPFLFCGIMSLACQSYNVYDIRSSAFSVAFMEQAEKLWKAERASDSLNTLAAMCYLSMAGTLSGKDNIACDFAAESRAMAFRMKLLGVQPTTQLVQSFLQQPPNKISALSYAAWGTYAWLTYRNGYFPEEPIVFPPVLPIPGDRESDSRPGSPAWPTQPLPVYLGRAFPALCKLWVIVQEIEAVYTLTDKTPLTYRVSLAFAESKYQKMLAWADTILPEMVRGDHNSSHILFFHGVYHCTVLTLFRPFLDTSQDLQLRSFSSIDGTPSVVFAVSLSQLKRIIFAYCIRTPRISHNGWFNAVIIQLSYAVLKNRTHDPEWFFYFRLCFHYWKDLYVRYPVFLPIVQASLVFAIKTGAISGVTARELLEGMRAVGMHHEQPEGALTRAVLDFDLAAQNLEESRMDAIGEEFEEVVMFNELINNAGE